MKKSVYSMPTPSTNRGLRCQLQQAGPLHRKENPAGPMPFYNPLESLKQAEGVSPTLITLECLLVWPLQSQEEPSGSLMNTLTAHCPEVL